MSSKASVSPINNGGYSETRTTTAVVPLTSMCRDDNTTNVEVPEINLPAISEPYDGEDVFPSSARSRDVSSSVRNSVTSLTASFRGLAPRSNKVSAVQNVDGGAAYDPETDRQCPSSLTSRYVIMNMWTMNDSVVCDSSAAHSDHDDNLVSETSFTHFEAQENYQWHASAHSPNIAVDACEPCRCRRLVAKQSTDGVRGHMGFMNGYHSFDISVNNKPWGHCFNVGVCTERTELHGRGYQNLLGQDSHSWCWNIPTGRLYHKGKDVGKFPIGYDGPFPKQFNLTLNLNDAMPNATVSWNVGTKKYKQMLFSLLDTSEPLYPAVACCYANTEITISYCSKYSLKPKVCTDTSTMNFWAATLTSDYLPCEIHEPQVVRPTEDFHVKNTVKWACAKGAEFVSDGRHVWGLRLVPDLPFRWTRKGDIEKQIAAYSQKIVIGVVVTSTDEEVPQHTDDVGTVAGFHGLDTSTGDLYSDKKITCAAGKKVNILEDELQLIVDCDNSSIHYCVYGSPLQVSIPISLRPGQVVTPCAWYRNCPLPLKIRYISGPGKERYTCSSEVYNKQCRPFRNRQFYKNHAYQLMSFNSHLHDWCESPSYELAKEFGKSQATNVHDDGRICIAHGSHAVTKGFHAWRITFRLEEPQFISVGVGTSDVNFLPDDQSLTSYVGSCYHSWGWDVLSGQLYHGGVCRGLMRQSLSNIIKTIPEEVIVLVYLHCHSGELWFAFDDDMKPEVDWNGDDIAFLRLPKHTEFHPMAAFSKGVASLQYLGEDPGRDGEVCVVL